MTMIKKWFLFSILFLSLCGSLAFFLTKKLRTRVANTKPIIENTESPVKAITLTEDWAYFLPLKIHGFNSVGIPYLEVQIEDIKFFAEIDLGFMGLLTLPFGFIDKLHKKTFLKQEPGYAFTGKSYQKNLYEIPAMWIGEMRIFPLIAEEMNLELVRDTCIRTEKTLQEEFSIGRIGWLLFREVNILVDCKHSQLVLCDSLETLKRKGQYPLEAFTETPLLLDHGFLEFEVETESGKLRCVLDTGSTYNMMNKDLETFCNDHMIMSLDKISEFPTLNPENKNLMIIDHENVYEVSTFNIGGKDFGPMTFSRIRTPLAIDAIMGMEFFEYMVVYIDFRNKKLYFYEIPEETVEILDASSISS